MRATLCICLSFLVMIAWITADPFLVISEFHYSMFDFGIFQAIIFDNFIIAAHLVKPLMAKYNINKIVLVGITIEFIGSLLSLFLVLFFPNTIYVVMLGMIFISFGSGLCFPILNRIVIESSEEPMGARMAIFSSFMGLFAMFGALIISLFYDGNLISMAILMAIAVAFAFILSMTKKR